MKFVVEPGYTVAMDAATRRRLIAMGSPLQAQVDARPRCEDCGLVLTRQDFLSYWDDDSPRGLVAPGMSAEERRAAVTPRCCEACAERAESP